MVKNDAELYYLLHQVRYMRQKAEKKLEELEEVVMTLRALEEQIESMMMQGAAE